MYKIFLILLLFGMVLRAGDNYELKLYEKVIPAIFKHRPIKVYGDSEVSKLLRHSRKFVMVKQCHKAHILIVAKVLDLPQVNCQEKPLFVTSYKAFKDNPNSFGAFYWRKGRPQIRFREEVMRRYHLTLPNALKRYAK